MYVIGLTGGIASGKSTIARRLSALGAVHIDADQLAREAVEPGTGALAAIVAEFGSDILNTDGTLDRAALGAIVFGNDAQRSTLNTIVHPAIRQLSDARMSQAAAADPDAIIVYDVPLLVEAVRDRAFDVIVVAHAPRDTRIARLVELRGMTVADAVARVDSQATDAERLEIADVVIETGGDLESTLDQADNLWRRVQATAAAVG